MKKILFLIGLLFSIQIQSGFADFNHSIMTQRATGYCYIFKINNSTSTNISNWKIQFAIPTNSNMNSKWSGNFSGSNGNYTITPLDWNKIIYPGANTEIGICVDNNISFPTNVVFTSENETTSTGNNNNGNSNSGNQNNNSNNNTGNNSNNNSQNTNNSNNIVLNYPQERWAESGVDLNNDGKSEQFMQINAWNIASSQGSASLIYDKNTKKYSYSQDLYNISLSDVGGWVHGYPEVFMGKKPHGSSYTNGWTLLPKKVKDLTSLSFSTKYSVVNTSNGPLNFATEGWIVKNPNNNHVSGDEIEFMIMFYKNNTGAAGNKIGSVILPLKVDGVLKNETFDIYKNKGGWDFFTFIPSRNYNNEKIEIDLYQFLPSIKNNISYNIDEHYFMNWEVGSEYGSPSVNSSKFSWTLDEFDVKVNETTSNNNSGSQNNNSNNNNSGSTTGNNNSGNNSSGNNNSQTDEEETFNIDDILKELADNEEKLTFTNITFKTTSFQTFQKNLDKFINKKMQNFSTGKYNEGVSVRNALLITLKKFEDNEFTKKQTLETLKKHILEFKEIF
ncbi:MAG: cellulose binding domain-containing protein [Candidatus Altimarinota bacterium]